jgi:hypothetical protein
MLADASRARESSAGFPRPRYAPFRLRSQSVGVSVFLLLHSLMTNVRMEERASGCPPPTPSAPCLSHVFTSWYVVACMMVVCVRGVRRGDTGVVIFAVILHCPPQLFASQQDERISGRFLCGSASAAPPTAASHARCAQSNFTSKATGGPPFLYVETIADVNVISMSGSDNRSLISPLLPHHRLSPAEAMPAMRRPLLRSMPYQVAA